MSILAVLTFNFLFTDPRFTFQAYDKSYPVTFAVMFISSIVTSKLATKVKLEERMARWFLLFKSISFKNGMRHSR